MPPFGIVQPSTSTEAAAFLASRAPIIDSPTQRRIFSAEHQRDALASGARKPSWVWAAIDDAGSDTLPIAVIAAWGPSGGTAPWLIDLFAVPLDQPDVGAALLRRATTDALAQGAEDLEINLFAPAVPDPTRDAAVAAVIEVAESCGYRVLVVRRRYEFDHPGATAVIPATELRFEPLARPNDPRLGAVYATILVGTLDAHSLAALRDASAEDVAAAELADMVELDPPESFFLAIDPTGTVVGLGVGSLRGRRDRGVVSFTGVSHDQCGRGDAKQILGWLTARLAAHGALTVIGETDVANEPMAAAFRTIGFPQSDSRIDLVYDPSADDAVSNHALAEETA